MNVNTRLSGLGGGSCSCISLDRIRAVVRHGVEPLSRRVGRLATVLVKLALLDQLLLGLCLNSPTIRDRSDGFQTETNVGTQTPAASVRITLHDNALDLGHNTVLAACHHRAGHLCNGCKQTHQFDVKHAKKQHTQCDSLALGGHQHDLVVHLDTILEAKETGQHLDAKIYDK